MTVTEQTKSEPMDLRVFAKGVLRHCTDRGWSLSPVDGGCHLHLEASEFIEALRGKGDSTPLEEAGDVFFVLLSLMEQHDLDPWDVLHALKAKLDAFPPVEVDYKTQLDSLGFGFLLTEEEDESR